jgi:hypothetical protein
MTRSEANAKFFPDDNLWQKHCSKISAYLNSLPPLTSQTCWDGRDDRGREDYLATSEQHARNILNGDV